jgi:hypothetical protein
MATLVAWLVFDTAAVPLGRQEKAQWHGHPLLRIIFEVAAQPRSVAPLRDEPLTAQRGPPLEYAGAHPLLACLIGMPGKLHPANSAIRRS